MLIASKYGDIVYALFRRLGRKKFSSNSSLEPLVPLYHIPLVTIKGEVITLEKYRGKRILIVNVASECGYTPQYAQLQELHDNSGNDIAVLGFPCNQFGSQEPGNEEQIIAFCSRAYGVTFPMFSKVLVSGPEQHPLFRWLSDPSMNGWNNVAPDWNFCKYVIDEKGKLLHYLSPSIKPFDERISG